MPCHAGSLIHSPGLSPRGHPYAPAHFSQETKTEWIDLGRSLWQWRTYDRAGVKWKWQKWFVEKAAALNFDYYLVDDG